jgi:hypothetical protein
MRLPLQSARTLPLATALLLLLLSCIWCDSTNASNPLLRDIKRFKRTLSSGPNAATSYNLATALLSLGNNSAALPHLLDALADPSFPGRHGTRGPPPPATICYNIPYRPRFSCVSDY